MTTRPWMPLYCADYLADTAHLDATESGAYLHLLMHYWINGGLPDDDRQLARISKLTPHLWKKYRPVIQKFFYDGWKHKRVEKELLNSRELSQKRSDAAKGRGKKAPAKAGANDEHLPTQSQSQSQPPSQFSSYEENIAPHFVRGDSAQPELVPPVANLPATTGISPSGNTGKELSRKESDWPADFREQFWAAYPRKIEKKAAIAALERVRKSGSVPWEKLIGAVRAYAETADPQYTKHPTTWLNKGCWDDEIRPRRANGGSAPPRYDPIEHARRQLAQLSQTEEDGTLWQKPVN